jgi:hypothetical protein
MCVEQLRENNNIVNVNTIKVSKLTKLFIHYSLNVDERIFEFYNSDIKLFFVLIKMKKNLCLFSNAIKNCKKKN